MLVGSKYEWLCSVFLDTQFPGAKDIVDPDGLLGQSDIARLPSIHPRLSELEFLRDLRALEVQPGAAADAPREGEKMQNTRSGQEDHPDQHAQQDESRLTAELLRMLSAEHISSPADDTAIADRSQGSTGHMSASLEHVTPGEGARRSRRKTRHAQAARLNAPDPTLVLDDFSASPVSRAGAQKYPVASQQTLPGSSLSQETGPSMREQAPPKRAKRKRVRRSEDEDPAWQPEEASSDLAAGPEHAALAEGQSASASPAKSAAQEAAPQHIPRSRYKGVSCHKCASHDLSQLACHVGACLNLLALSRYEAVCIPLYVLFWGIRRSSQCQVSLRGCRSQEERSSLVTGEVDNTAYAFLQADIQVGGLFVAGWAAGLPRRLCHRRGGCQSI